jgi:hypothetical protein
MGIGIGTALVIGAVTSTAGSAGVSFAQAGKQRRLQQQAEEEAAKALAEARKKLDVNYYASLGINKEPYELEREALVSAGAQAIQAGQESERGAAATAGRIQMAQQQGQREIAGAMGTDMLNLDKLTAEESSRLATDQAKLYLSEAEGAQLAARDAQQAATAFTTAGVKGIADTATQAISSLVPLYPNTGIDVTASAGGTAPATSNQTFQGTPFAAPSALGLGQIAPQASRAVMPQGNIAQANIASQFKNTPFGTAMPFGGAQGASPLNAFNNPALGGITKDQLGAMSRGELLKLLGGI